MRKVLLLVLATFSLAGCGSGFVALRKDLGTETGRRPRLGIVFDRYRVNNVSDPAIDVLFAQEMSEYIQSAGGAAIPIDQAQYPQIDKAAQKYLELQLGGRGKVTPETKLGDMSADFTKAGIDGIVLVQGGGASPSPDEVLKRTAVNTGFAVGAALLGGVFVPTDTPVAYFNTLVAGRDGAPIYYDRCGYYRIFRRDIGDTASRRRMYAHEYERLPASIR